MKKSTKLMRKLLLGIGVTAAIGLVVTFFIVNTIVRSSIYDNIIDAAQNDMTAYANELDGWFVNGGYILENISVTFEYLGRGNIMEMARRFQEQYDFLELAFIGFGDDGAFDSGVGSARREGWVLFERPWYIDGVAAGGEVVFTDPYVSTTPPYSLVVSAVRYMPNFYHSVAGIDIILDDIEMLLASFEVYGGGYLFLLSSGGDIVSHPDAAISPTVAGINNISRIPVYNDAFSPIAQDRYGITRFTNHQGVFSYMMTFPMESTGWTLVSVFPVSATEAPVWQSLIIILITFFAVILIFGLVMAAVITRSVLKPIKRLETLVSQVKQGKLNINRDTTQLANDEIGRLSHDIYDLVDIIKAMVQDLIKINYEFNVVGDIEYRADASKYENSFKEMVESVNSIMGHQVEDVLNMLEMLNQVAGGNFDVKIKDLPGKKMLVPQTLRALVSNLKGINDEVSFMIESMAVKGDLHFQIDAEKYDGDWREIMTGLNNVIKAVDEPIIEIGDVMDNLSQGDFTSKVNGNYKGSFLQIKDAVNRTTEILSGYITEISEDLLAISRGDLTTEITREFVGSFGAIKESLNSISASLHRTMSEIAAASDQVLLGARHVADSAADLANGAIEQTTAIQELNTSIDMINQQTQQNADSTVEANVLSNKSTDSARAGNDAMKQMSEAMLGIKESSDNISRIVKVIQDIAFQTNLLALNASVEAARAGEHGKGFSVVAEEVRNLAARSQTAATETTGLIADSISRVKTGSVIVESTSEALDVIVSNANEVLHIINSISASSREQAEAVGQVSTSLDQISSVVQSNSSASEEAAAASEELTSQAELLRQLVAYFRL